MAIVLKEGKTYNPSISTDYGIDMTNGNYYGVIDNIQYDKKERTCVFLLNIYASKQIRDNNGSVADRLIFSYDGEIFDAIGNNGLSIATAYSMILTDPKLSDWKSDEV